MAPGHEITRRAVLHLLGLGAVGMTVGGTAVACGRSEQAADDSTAFHAAYPYSAPPKGNYNYLGGVADQISLGYLFDLMFVPGAMYLWHARSYHYLLADESSALSADGKTFTYVVRAGLTWSDGKPITADDVYATWLLRSANSHPVFEYVDGFERTDDMTVTFHIPTPAPTVQYYLLRERPVSAAVYGKWADRLGPLITAGKASDGPDVAAVMEEVNAFTPDEAVVSGPIRIDYDRAGNASLTMVKNSKGYRVDDIHFDTITVYNGETNSITPIVLEKKIDYATHGFPLPTEKQLEKAGFRIMRAPVYTGPALYINFAKLPEFEDKRARQALAHAIDRTQNAFVAQADSGAPVQLMAGISDLLEPLGITISVIGADSTQQADFVMRGKFELAIQSWGSSSNPYPAAAFRGPLLDFNYPGSDPDRGIDFPLEQQTDAVGRIDFEQAIVDAGLGASVDALNANVTPLVRAFNELLPVIPLWERMTNNPILESTVAGWPPDDDPIYDNSIYADNFTTILLYDGMLEPA